MIPTTCSGKRTTSVASPIAPFADAIISRSASWPTAKVPYGSRWTRFRKNAFATMPAESGR